MIKDTIVTRDAFISIARQSKCSRNLDDCLKAKEPEKILAYKDKVFGMIYDTIGRDQKLASDLEDALMVKNTKFLPWQVCILSVLTCGLFVLLRPRDDDALLVLTKQGRVIALKMERQGCIEGTTMEIVLMFTKWIIILAAALCLPALLVWVLLSGHAMSKSFEKRWGISELDRLQIDEDMMNRFKRHYVLGAEVFFGLVLALCFYLWTKCPSDYGNRYRESYSASQCSAGQLCITGTKTSRQVIMRLYFGKYPTQAMLDQHGAVAGSQGSVCQVLPLSSLGAAGTTGGGSKDAKRLKRPSPGAMTTGLVVLLSVVTMLDTALTWFDRAMAASELVKEGSFCRDAPSPEKPGAQEHCTPPVCRKWAHKNGHPDEFCEGVFWHNNIESPSQKATCVSYGYPSTPCCGGCGMGGLLTAAKEGGWMAVVQELLGIIGDVGTLVFSFMAATAAVTQEASADFFDVTVNRSRFNDSLEVDANFDFSYPAMQNFFESVYRQHRMPKEGEKQKTSTTNFLKVLNHEGTTATNLSGATDADPLYKNDEDDNMAPSGVTMYEKNKDHNDWVDFFDNCSLTQSIDGSWVNKKVIVPVNCLGMIDAVDYPDDPRAEHIVAAWSESPMLVWSRLLTPICGALLLLFVLIAAPQSVSEKPIVLPGLPKNPLGRVVTALLGAFGILFFGIIFEYMKMVLNGITHAVVVTDQRVFYIRHQAPCIWLCKFGLGLRIDVFRHDRNVTYGKVECRPRSLWQRLTRSPILPGSVLMKVKFGIVQLDRQYGNIWNVFHVVQQLCAESVAHFLKKGYDETDSAWNWDESQKEANDNLEEISVNGVSHPGIRHIHAQPTDLAAIGPGIYMLTKKVDGKVEETEKPLLHWSIRTVGPVATAFDASQDVVVTTGRVFIWSRSQFKEFNCKSAFLWGACYCGWLSALTQKEHLPNTMSFFTLSELLSFSTNTSVEPPAWSDPVNGPLRVPFWDKLCAIMTACMTCTTRLKPIPEDDDEDVLQGGWGNFSIVPKRRSPICQLYMMWRLRTGPQQADLMCCISPFDHKDFEDTDLFESLGCWQDAKKMPETTVHSRKVEELRAIMGVAQDAAEGAF